MPKMLFNTDGTPTPAAPAEAVPAGVQPQAAAPAPEAQPVPAAPTAPVLDPEWAEVAARMKQEGFTPAQIAKAMWGPVEEPTRTAPPPPPQGVDIAALENHYKVWQAKERHNEALAAQDSVYSADIEKAAGADASLKDTLALVAQGIRQKIAANHRYPAGHPLAGQQAPITQDVWAKQGKTEFEKALATIKGNAIRAAASVPGQPGQVPASTTTPPKPMDRWNRPVKTFDVNKFTEDFNNLKSQYTRVPS